MAGPEYRTLSWQHCNVIHAPCGKSQQVKELGMHMQQPIRKQLPRIMTAGAFLESAAHYAAPSCALSGKSYICLKADKHVRCWTGDRTSRCALLAWRSYLGHHSFVHHSSALSQSCSAPSNIQKVHFGSVPQATALRSRMLGIQPSLIQQRKYMIVKAFGHLLLIRMLRDLQYTLL